MQVYCDMESDGGGWVVFQRRMDGTEDFYRGWDDYVKGFGDLNGEFWLGLNKIHRLTNAVTDVNSTLRVELEDFDKQTRFAKYDLFKVNDSSTKYQIEIGGYSGDAADSMTYCDGMKFSTKDQDNDVYGSSCATRFKGGWWYKSCHHANLNGLYLSGTHSTYADGIEWYHWKGYYYSLKISEMKIR